MSVPGRPTIEALADQVVEADVTSQAAIARTTKGPVVSDEKTIPFIPTWWQAGPKPTTGFHWTTTTIAIGVIGAIIVVGTGIITGIAIFGGGPAPTLTAAATATAVTATPVASTPTPVPATPVASSPTPVTATPVVSTPTPVVSISPVPVPANATVTALTEAGLIDGPVTTCVDPDEKPGTPDPDEDPQDSPDSENLTDAWVGSGDLSQQDVAALDGLFAAGDRTAVVQERFPCTDPSVFCGPARLEPGLYHFIGFTAAGPVPRQGTANIYQVYYVATDLDGDWTNDRLVTPPRTDDIYLSTQYVTEAGWYGATKGLGQTDFRGPLGPDGKTQRYNQKPTARMVLTQDPPGGFFIVPDAQMGPWFRIASYWQDFSKKGVLAVDWIAVSPRLGLIPTPGRNHPPASLACGRVDLVAEALADQPAHLAVVLGLRDGASLPPDPTVSFSMTSNADRVDLTALPLTEVGSGVLTFQVPAAPQASHAFTALRLTGSDGAVLDITEEFIVLTGAGVNAPAGVAGLALGDPACGA